MIGAQNGGSGQSWALTALLLVGACAGPSHANEPMPGTQSSGMSRGDPGSSTGDSPPTSTGASTDTDTGTTTGGETSDDCGYLFLTCEPPGPSPLECSVINDTCPPGEKCNFYSNGESTTWNATKCFPEVERPHAVDAACAVQGSAVSGIDSCERGSICWDVDSDTGVGVCVPFCTGSENAPVCEDPFRSCPVLGDGVLLLCLPMCSPLDPESCRDGEGCYPVNDGFQCAPDASGRGGGPLTPCEFINACDAGSACTSPQQVGACPPDASACCAPFCDLSDPECPDGTTCAPHFERRHPAPEYDNLGLCGGDPG